MSAEVVVPSTPLAHSEKRKDKSEKKRSRKRQREEMNEEQEVVRASQPSPTKKQRIDAAEETDQDTIPPSAQAPSEEDPSQSPFVIQTATLYLALSPISQNYPVEGLCAEHLSPLLLTYYPPLKGVILSYSNPRLSESKNGSSGSGAPVLARSIDEYAVSFVWLTADFLLLKPRKGIWIEGHVNLQNEGHLGIVCWNLFNASIERKRLPEGWTWVSRGKTPKETDTAEEEEDYYVDGSGNKIGGPIRFRIRDFEAAPATDKEKGFITIEGTLLGEEADAEMDKKEQERRQKRPMGAQDFRKGIGRQRDKTPRPNAGSS